MSTLEHEPVRKVKTQEQRTLKGDIELLKESKLVKNFGRLALFTAATGMAIAGGAEIGKATGPAYEFSDETQTIPVSHGDTLWSIIGDNIDTSGIDIREVVSHVKSDPANEGVFEDDILTPGEVVIIPESVNQ